jgi:WD repeat-containing protein 59
LSAGVNSNSFITNNYSEFYHHPKTYEQFEEYKEIAAMSRQGRNATVLASANNGAFGDYSGYEDVEDDMDEGIHNNSSLYLRPEVSYCLDNNTIAMGSNL